MSRDDSNDYFRPPNDNAYETDERRTGPPLRYVAEKLRHSLEAGHDLIRTIRRRVPDDLCVDAPSAGTPVSVKEEFLLPAALLAFHSGLVSYLAMNNLLALANESDFDDRLLTYSREEFKAWLDRIDQGGSVTG